MIGIHRFLKSIGAYTIPNEVIDKCEELLQIKKLEKSVKKFLSSKGLQLNDELLIKDIPDGIAVIYETALPDEGLRRIAIEIKLTENEKKSLGNKKVVKKILGVLEQNSPNVHFQTVNTAKIPVQKKHESYSSYDKS